MKYPDAFLKTVDNDEESSRRLLCTVASSLSHTRYKFLDAKGTVAWAKAAIAADPTYHNVYMRCADGLLIEHLYVQSLEYYNKALTLRELGVFNREQRDNLEETMTLLETIVNSEVKSIEWKTAIRDVRGRCRSFAIRRYKDQDMERSKKSCAMCSWPAKGKEISCSKCLTVCYCHQYCQLAHWQDHKQNCISTKKKDQNKLEQEVYPEPDYPQSEWVSDEEYKECQKLAKMCELSMIHWSAHQGFVEVLKRALMVEKNALEKINTLFHLEYPIHSAALRNEPHTAVEICRILVKHGACPNIYRGDNYHLLDICRDRAKWFELRGTRSKSTLYLMSLRQMEPGMEEFIERKESKELVELITAAIKNHTLCKHCKKQNAVRTKVNAIIEQDGTL